MDGMTWFQIPDIDTGTPSLARMYDHYLGGRHNFEVDRDACAHLDSATPGARELARADHDFVRRAVQRLAGEHGVRQFLDIGCGLPAGEGVAEIAQRADPLTRVVHVDNDPVALACTREMVAAGGLSEQVGVVAADVRDLPAILAGPEATRLLHPGEPTAVLLAGVLNVVPDADDPRELIRQALRAAGPGGYLLVSHFVSACKLLRRELTDLLLAVTGGRFGELRDPDEVRAWFDEVELLDPGFVDAAAWHPEPGGASPAVLDELDWGVVAGVVRVP